MELYDVMRTAFAAREFTDNPLVDEMLFNVLDVARFAPSGGNRRASESSWFAIAGPGRPWPS